MTATSDRFGAPFEGRYKAVRTWDGHLMEQPR